MNNIQKLLSDVNAKIKALETENELYSEKLASNFRVFDYLRDDELGLSRIIADLLNPNGNHGQKTLFLANFIKICLPNIHNHENKIWQNYLTNLSKTHVKTEDTTTAIQSYRRMDIYLSATINNESFGICIENKPYASDQPEQLSDYFKELKKRNLTHKHIVYLSEYSEPSENSVKSDVLERWQKNKVFSHVTYTQLVEWLAECKKDCQNHSVTEFLNQFIKFIQKRFMGVENMSEQNEVLKVIQSDAKNIRSAIRISSSIDKMKEELIKVFISQLETKSQNKGYQVKTDGINPNSKRQNIRFEIDDLTDFDIRIQFENTHYSTFFIGVWALNSQEVNSKKYQETYQAVKSKEHELQTNGKPIKCDHNQWCAWYDFEPTHWNNDPEVWADIQTGALSDRIIKDVDKLCEVFTSMR